MRNLAGEEAAAPATGGQAAEVVGGHGGPGGLRRRSLASRLSAGHLVMIVAGLLGALLSLAALRASDHRVEVAVAAHEMPAGSTFDSNDVRWVRVAADGDVTRALVRRDDVTALRGTIATSRVRAGELLSRHALVRAAAPHRARSLGIPVTPEHAVGGDVQVGDRVDVLSTDGESAGLVVANLEVRDVKRQSSTLGGGDDKLTVVVAVSAAQADALAPVLGSDKFVLALSTGAEPAEVPTAAVGDTGRGSVGRPGG
ncbi:MAG: SAF domain-containing protein [Acidimicrobiia bacterium]